MDENKIENPTAKLAPVFDEAFKYQIGEQVTFRTCITTLTCENTANTGYKKGSFSSRRVVGPPIVAHICERLMQQCHGGVQLQYAVKAFSVQGGENAKWVMEHSLAPLSEWEEAASGLFETYNVDEG